MSDLEAKLREHGITKKGGLRQGDNYTICPNCSAQRKPANRSKPCLSVKLDADGGAVWLCHHCEWSGNVPGTATGRDGQPYPQRQTVEPRRPAKQPPAKPARPRGLMAFFAGRGIGEEVVEELGIYQARVWFPQIEAEAPAIVFPYRRNSVVVNNKYRSADKLFRQDKDAEKVLYNIDSVVDDDEMIWVEGEMDVAALMQVGYRQVTTLPDGAPKKVKAESDPDDKRYAPLFNCMDRIETVKKHIIAGDGDGPGMALREELARRLGKEKCWKVTWPEDSKDANKTLMDHGPEKVQQCIDGATGWPISGLFQLERGSLLAFRDKAPERLFSTGWRSLDDTLRIPLGALMVVTGIPSHGKSEFIDALMVNTAMTYNWRWAVCSVENNPLEQHAAMLVEKFQGKPYENYGTLSRMDDFEVQAGESWLNQHFSFIRDDNDDALTVDFILDKARIAVLRHGIRGLVIDPYNEIEHSRPKNQTETEYVSQLLGRIRKFGMRHDLTAIVVAHPQKLQKIDGKVPIPGLYDISGSANWYNKADIGITVHRPDDNEYWADIHVQKVRRKSWGRKGQFVRLEWDKATGRYSEITTTSDRML